MDILIAIQFLTRIPVTLRSAVSTEAMARAMAWFPAAGFLIGLMAAAVHYLSTLAFAESIGDFLAIAFLIAITGNMHGDGLMDTADGFFSGKPRERILEIMHDSRVGSHGVMAGAGLFLAKFLFLAQVPASLKYPALVIFPVFGRWTQVYAATLYPYVSRTSGTGSFASSVGRREIAIASAFTLGAAALLLGPMKCIGAAVFALAAATLVTRLAYNRIGGITGDVLGAVNECAELACLLFLGHV